MAYRESRNIEATLIDYISAQLIVDGWSGIDTEKVFANIYKNEPPGILINQLLDDPVTLEIGSKTKIYYRIVEIRVFATSDGERLDLKDWLLEKLENDIDYYAYQTGGALATRVLTGKINIEEILRCEKELTNTENLEQADKYRHLISFRCKVST